MPDDHPYDRSLSAAPGSGISSGWPRNVDEVKQRLHQLWHGDIPLAQTFWLYYFGIIFVLELLSKTQGSLGALFSILALAWNAFMVKPIIASSDKYTGDKIWAYIAKAAAAVIALGVLTHLLTM